MSIIYCSRYDSLILVVVFSFFPYPLLSLSFCSHNMMRLKLRQGYLKFLVCLSCAVTCIHSDLVCNATPSPICNIRFPARSPFGGVIRKHSQYLSLAPFFFSPFCGSSGGKGARGKRIRGGQYQQHKILSFLHSPLRVQPAR